MTKTPLHIRITVPIYKSWVYVVININECKHLAKLKTGMTLDDDEFAANGMTIYGHGRNIIWLPENADIDTLAHECMHVVLNIFRVKGVSVDLENQEPTTYLVGYITGEVYKAFNKLKAAQNG